MRRAYPGSPACALTQPECFNGDLGISVQGLGISSQGHFRLC